MVNQNSLIAKQVLVVGLGLIGGSFAKAIKNAGVCERVLGSTRSDETLRKAKAQGVIDEGSNDLGEIASQLEAGDVVLIATPTLTVPDKLRCLKEALLRKVIVTDGASVKGDIELKAREIFEHMPPYLVLGHPIAGSERSGIDAINENLYQKHRVILTPAEETDASALKTVTRLWEAVGADVFHMPVNDHDSVLAATSHLPHILAFSLMEMLTQRLHSEEVAKYAASGFSDFIRIAGSDPQMWHDIAISNRDAILEALDIFHDRLTDLKQAIESGNSPKVMEQLSRAKQARDGFAEQQAVGGTNESYKR